MLKFFPQKTPAPQPRPVPAPPTQPPAVQPPPPAPAPAAVEHEPAVADDVADADPALSDEPVASLVPAESTFVDAAPAPVAPALAPVAPVRASFTYDKPKVPEKAPVMPENPNKNILSKDVEIKGNIKFTNELVIDGKIEGEISSDGVLTVGENADIRGEIKTKSVTVLGKVNGNITVGERCELKARAHLVGDLKAARLVIEEGATFVGKSEVASGGKAAPAKTATPNGDATFTGAR